MNKFSRRLFGAVETVSDYLVEYAFRHHRNLPRPVIEGIDSAGSKLLNLIPDTYWETN